MSKVIVAVGYTNYVVNAEDAVKLAEILSSAERYEMKYKPESEGGSLHYVWENDNPTEGALTPMTLISDTFYRLAKLAGKPEKD